MIAELCHDHDAIAITDEIYEHLVYRGRARQHRDAARHGRADDHDQRRQQDLLGDRLAYRLDHRAAAAHYGIRKVHDFLTVGAAASAADGGRGRASSSPLPFM